ncbi:MAG: permease-like cell division protein FtsX [candidate division Zixibacteria bacterium]
MFLLFDIFWISADTSDRFYSSLLSDLQMHVYLSESLTDSSAALLSSELTEIDGVNAVQLVSKEMARRELATLVGTDLLIGYDNNNPLPRSYILGFEPEYLTVSKMEEIESRIIAIANIDKVDYSRQWLQKAEFTRSIVLKIGLVLGGLIILTTLITFGNSIRLMTRARAVGFTQMRLLGAGRMFLAMPFLLEGFLMGCVSAALGWGAIIYFYKRIAFRQLEIVMPTFDEIVLFCLAMGALGILSGFVGIRKLLR